jgi:hypothetical protein
VINNARDKSRLPATVSVSNPGDFQLGSVESRAAMRAMIEREKETGFRFRIIMIGHPPEDCQGRWCSGACGLVTGSFFVNEDGKVEQPLVNHGRV